jgi:diguanylate cyclase (GGDEF)-like protein
MQPGLVARIALVFVAVAASACVATVIDALALADMTRRTHELLERDMAEAVSVTRSQNHLLRMNSNLAGSALIGHRNTGAQNTDAQTTAVRNTEIRNTELLHQSVQKSLADYRTRLREMRAASPLGAQQAATLTPGFEQIQARLNVLFALIDAGRTEAARDTLAAEVTPAIERQAVLGRAIQDENWSALSVARERMQALARERLCDVAALGAVPVLTLVLGLFWLAGPGLRRPMRSLTRATERLRLGDLEQTVRGTERRDEIGAIATSLDMLRRQALRARVLEAVAQDQAALAEAERLRDLTDAAFEGLAIIENGAVIQANTSLAAMLGLDREQMIGAQLGDLLVLEGARRVQDLLEEAAQGPAPARLAHAEGAYPAELRARKLSAAADQARLVVAVRDLRSQVAAEARIRHMAQHDVLTGAANRALLRERLLHEFANAGATGGRFALLCIDLDRFKPVNDLHGHAAGDRVLCEVGRRLQGNTRGADTVARLGGDEFVVLQTSVTAVDQAIDLASRLVMVLNQPYDIGDGKVVELSASIGIALHPEDGTAPDALLANADSALYRVKRSSRNGYALFHADMDAGQHERHLLEHHLRHALARGEFTLSYQIQAACKSCDVAGFEALLRWNHALRGNVSPADFIPVAEDCGLIIDIGAWVLREACAEAARWEVPLRIAVNVSPRQLEQAGFAELVADTLAQTGLHPARLELEITEGLLIRKADQALAVIKTLKALGVQMALDDFGTGYSSLVALRNFPFDRVKVDRTFVQHLTESAEARAIISAVVALGRALSIPVLAEGVETQAQLDVLREAGCEEIQGYLIGRPQPIGQQRHITHPAARRPNVAPRLEAAGVG